MDLINKKVFFIESSYTGAGKELARYCNDSYISAYLLARDPKVYEYVEDFESLTLIECNTLSQSDICSVIERVASGVDFGVCTSDDYSVEMVARICEHFAIPGPSVTVSRMCRSKNVQRETLSQLCPDHTVEFTFLESASQIPEFKDKRILKPVSLTGSQGVAEVTTREEAITQFEALTKLIAPGAEGAYSGAILEEVAEGFEYSAEVFNGKVVCVTKKFNGGETGFVECGQIVPAPITHKEYSDHIGQVEEICQKLGLSFGPYHVEYIYCSRSKTVKIVEFNGRLAGDQIPLLLKKEYDIDLFKQTVLNCLGITQPVPLVKNTSSYIGIRFKLAGEPDIFSRVGDSQDVEILALQERKIPIGSASYSNLDRYGFSIARSNDSTSLIEALNLA